MKPTLLVLAAGIGSRYGGLKQIDPVGPSGEIIIDYSVFDAIRAGFGKVVFLIRKDIEKDFKECVSSKYLGHIEVDYAFQEISMIPSPFKVPSDRKKPWGTGHAILCAENKVDVPFAVINADDYYGRAGYRLMHERLVNAKDGAMADYCMTGFILRNTLSENGFVSRGVCSCDHNGYLLDVVERTHIEKAGNGAAKYIDKDGTEHPLTADETVSMNMWGFTPSIFGHLKTMFSEFLSKEIGSPKSEFFIPSVVSELISRKLARVKVMSSPDPWFGITYKEDKASVVQSIKSLVDSGAYPSKLF